MVDGEDDQVGEVLDLAEFPEDNDPDNDNAPPVIAFADDPAAEADETPLIKQLRGQIRDLSRKANRTQDSGVSVDPEPVIPAKPNLEALDWDQDRFDAEYDKREAAMAAQAEWKVRQAQREQQRKAFDDEQARSIDQQRNALGVSDYEARAASVKETLSDQQLAILVAAADNPAQLIYALGRSQSRLDQIAGQDNLAKFAAMVGRMEKDIRVSKRKPAAVETGVRGATAPLASGGVDKKLERLEKEAEATGNRSKIQAYKRELRAAQRAA
jgi:hypothetical protein